MTTTQVLRALTYAHVIMLGFAAPFTNIGMVPTWLALSLTAVVGFLLGYVCMAAVKNEK